MLGHATRSPRWDIPKGVASPGESFREAAARELLEETGLEITAGVLKELGVHAYLPNKDLALFALVLMQMPDPQALVCVTRFRAPSGAELPEFDRFAVLPWHEAQLRIGKNLARVLSDVRRRELSGASE